MRFVTAGIGCSVWRFSFGGPGYASRQRVFGAADADAKESVWSAWDPFSGPFPAGGAGRMHWPNPPVQATLLRSASQRA